MSFIQYVDWKPGAAALTTIDHANRIIADYQDQGFTLTLRQLYYQFVQEGLIPNNLRSYKRLGDVLNRGRLAGLVPWEAMEDRTRNRDALPNWQVPKDFMRDAVNWFHVDMWEGQSYRPEVWIEKDALVGVIEGVCRRHDVAFFSCRGYTSQSEQWRAGQRFTETLEDGQFPIVLHLGDHDPSGRDMTRDNHDRLSLFAGEDVEVKRLALNWDQIEQYNPPPNPAKFTDSRAEGYVREFGTSCWELDALRPNVIADLIEGEILALKEEAPWAEAEQRKAEGQAVIRALWREME